MYTLRKIEKKDYSKIVEINKAVVQHTSQMDENWLDELIGYANYAILAEKDNEVVGFLISMGPNKPYVNANYEWFSERYNNLLYIDRIAVDPKYIGKGIGSFLYKNLFELSKNEDFSKFACEINLVPPNEPSILFHKKHGFKEVGTQWLNDNTKKVSMQVANNLL